VEGSSQEGRNISHGKVLLETIAPLDAPLGDVQMPFSNAEGNTMARKGRTIDADTV